MPDIVIKVLENLRDAQLIQKEKDDEQSRIDRSKQNQKNKNGLDYDIASIDGFHSGSAESARGENNDPIFRPVDNKQSEKQAYNVRKDKIFNSAVSPDLNNNSSFNSNKQFEKQKDSNKSNEINNSNSSIKKPSKIGQPNRNFLVEEIK